MAHKLYLKRQLLLISIIVLLIFSACSRILPNAWSTPDVNRQGLFNGVVYQRLSRSQPRLMVAHVLIIDLRKAGIEFLVTPGDPKNALPLTARTTSQFLEEFELQAAINGDVFAPWYSNHPLDFSPASGDQVTTLGFSASRGSIYAYGSGNKPTLYISRANRAQFNTPPGKVYHAISGTHMLVENGKVSADLENYSDSSQPRSAIGLDKAGKRLFLVVVDGRQPGYSEGIQLTELANLLIEVGVYQAMNLDGGGSSTLVVQGANGKAQVLNSPIHTSIPGRERPVANHLGVYARELKTKE
jgi:uncharacterized protein YigE (DUF2233 family)